MRILVSGSTGFLGTALTDVLEREGHTIVRVVRPVTGQRETSGTPAKNVRWDPVGGHSLRRQASLCAALSCPVARQNHRGWGAPPGGVLLPTTRCAELVAPASAARVIGRERQIQNVSALVSVRTPPIGFCPFGN